jgi:hypothetical protein
MKTSKTDVFVTYPGGVELSERHFCSCKSWSCYEERKAKNLDRNFRFVVFR